MTKRMLGIIVVAAAMAISILGGLGLVQGARMGDFYLPVSILIAVLGVFYKLLYDKRYPLGVVVALLLAFHHVTMLRYDVDFLNVSYSLVRTDAVGIVVLAVFLVGCAIAFMFPQKALTQGNKLSAFF